MTVVLGIETATIDVAACVADETGPKALRRQAGTRAQERTLHVAITEVLAEAGVRFSDLDAIAVDVGPGRFTGLRVGVSAAKALAYACGRPLIGFTSAEILAAEAGPDLPVVAVVDLRRGEVAALLPGGTAPADLVRARPDDLGRLLRSDALLDALLVGDGAIVYANSIAEGAGHELRIGGAEFAAPSAATLCRLAVESFARGATSDAIALQALYMRGADVRIGWDTIDGTRAKSAAVEVG